MGRPGHESQSEQIVGVVLELLESQGYDAVQLREVARRAHVSLATVYKWFPTRNELIVAAVERWMAVNSYAAVAAPAPEETLREGLTRLLHTVFEPWENNPRMLEAYYRARGGAGGQRLDVQGVEAILPFANPLIEGADPCYVTDIGLVLSNMTYALIGRFVDKSLDITEILPTLDRVIYRLTSDNAQDATAARGAAARGASFDPALAAPFDRR
ncbi:TetR family transcriptional regulator [Nocardia bovistercoris]|uniref:TetR family transcriptional regulator n=1 Tax=Nocardia bovistercoris TaxID=2785916 RepID=UPI002FCD430A